MESIDYEFVDGRLTEKVVAAKTAVEKAAGTVRGLSEAAQISIFSKFLSQL